MNGLPSIQLEDLARQRMEQTARAARCYRDTRTPAAPRRRRRGAWRGVWRLVRSRVAVAGP